MNNLRIPFIKWIILTFVEVVKGMVRVKASLIFLFLIVPIVRSSQVSTKDVCVFSEKDRPAWRKYENSKECWPVTPFYFSYSSWWPWHVCIQVQANLSMAELEVLDANTKYWLGTQNTGRTIGESCREIIRITGNVLYYQRQPTSINACMNTNRICFARPRSTF